MSTTTTATATELKTLDTTKRWGMDDAGDKAIMRYLKRQGYRLTYDFEIIAPGFEVVGSVINDTSVGQQYIKLVQKRKSKTKDATLGS